MQNVLNSLSIISLYIERLRDLLNLSSLSKEIRSRIVRTILFSRVPTKTFNMIVLSRNEPFYIRRSKTLFEGVLSGTVKEHLFGDDLTLKSFYILGRLTGAFSIHTEKAPIFEMNIEEGGIRRVLSHEYLEITDQEEKISYTLFRTPRGIGSVRVILDQGRVSRIDVVLETLSSEKIKKLLVGHEKLRHARISKSSLTRTLTTTFENGRASSFLLLRSGHLMTNLMFTEKGSLSKIEYVKDRMIECVPFQDGVRLKSVKTQMGTSVRRNGEKRQESFLVLEV